MTTPSPPMPRDTIKISSLTVHLPNGLGPSAFSLPSVPCPLILTLEIGLSGDVVPHCLVHDSMPSLGVNYSSISKEVYAALSSGIQASNSSSSSLSNLTASPSGVASSSSDKERSDGKLVGKVLDRVAEVVFFGTHGGGDCVETLRVCAELPRGFLYAESGVYSALYNRNQPLPISTSESSSTSIFPSTTTSTSTGVSSTSTNLSTSILGDRIIKSEESFELRNIRTDCVVGLHPHERRERQRMELDIVLSGKRGGGWDHKSFEKNGYEYLKASSFGTIEALADSLAHHLLTTPPLTSNNTQSVSITLRKPSALPYAIPSITIHRTMQDFTSRSSTSSQSGRAPEISSQSLERNEERVFIALGSNIGDRIGFIKSAVQAVEDGGGRLVACSRLYESEPMYVEDQDRFINGVIEIRTSLSPIDLLRLLKRTEKYIGRQKTFRNGPRVIDLDLVFYGERVVKVGERGNSEDEDGLGWLECPHVSLGEREFVLRPLADIAPDFIHPSFGVSISELLSRLPPSPTPQLSPIIPYPQPSQVIRLSTPSNPLIMAILNTTPDSFSDGDILNTSSEGAYESFKPLMSLPFPPDIIDIGGMSTRPNSLPCSMEEEIERVVPLIKKIRSEGWKTVISVDTYRPEVARLAIQAGGSCINDVRGGREDGMLEAMAELDVPVILMHSRGDSTTMTTAEVQDYELLGGVVQGVRKEMLEMVEKALEAGVKRWNIILDPGLGFAKSQKDNLKLIRGLEGLTGEGELKGYPWLVGGSRKGFVGKVIGREKKEEAKERGYGDAAVNSWCVASGAVDILRVHDSRAARECVMMGLAIRDA